MDKQNKRKELKKLLTALTLITVLLMSGCSNNKGSSEYEDVVIEYASIQHMLDDEKYISDDDLKDIVHNYLASKYDGSRPEAAKEFLECVVNDTDKLYSRDINKRKIILECIQQGDCGIYSDSLNEINYRYYNILEYLVDESSWYDNNIVKNFSDTIEPAGYLGNVYAYGGYDAGILAEMIESVSCLKEYEPFQFFDVNDEYQRYIIYVPKGTHLRAQEYEFDDIVYLNTVEGQLENGFNVSIYVYLMPTEDDRKAIGFHFEEYDYSDEEREAIINIAENAIYFN